MFFILMTVCSPTAYSSHTATKGVCGMDLQSIMLILTIGLASNLDNAGVGISYGIRNIHIPIKANLMIAVISSLASFIGGAFGNWLTQWIRPILAHLLGTIVMVTVGLWVLLQPLLKKKSNNDPTTNRLTEILRDPEKADRDQSKSINFMESILLGIALSMNALAGGFDVGITQSNIIFAAIVMGVLSFLTISICCWIGRKFMSEKLGDRATILSGLLLIYIGLLQIF